jgi:hypothetical protein
MKQQRKPRPRVLLDTNVWRDLADADAGDTVRRVARRAGVTVQIAPSTVYEALRTGNPEIRSRMIDLMERSGWVRLMPEAYSGSQEVLREIRRLRPQWLRSVPDIQSLKRLEHDWARSRGGFWDRARFDTAAEAERVRVLGDQDLAVARSDAEYLRARARDAGWSFDSIDLAKVKQRSAFPVWGWDGDDVEPWRWAAVAAFSAALKSPDHAYAEWLSPFVNLAGARASRESWVRFWLYDVATLNMQRSWIRWAVEVLQSLRTVSPGTPCDNQLSTYLIECDYFISADGAFVSIVEKCRASASFRIASPVRVPGGGRSVSDVAQVLHKIGEARAGGDRR